MFYLNDKTRLIRKWHLFDGRTIHLQRFDGKKWKTTAWCVKTRWFEAWMDYYKYLLLKESANKYQSKK